MEEFSIPTYDRTRHWIREFAAISFESGKEYFIRMRLEDLAKEEGFKSVEALLEKLNSEHRFGSLHAKVVDQLTNNETLFFRDFHPF